MKKLTVSNDQIEETVKKRGKPKAQKSYGSGHTVLYYEEKKEEPPSKG